MAMSKSLARHQLAAKSANLVSAMGLGKKVRTGGSAKNANLVHGKKCRKLVPIKGFGHRKILHINFIFINVKVRTGGSAKSANLVVGKKCEQGARQKSANLVSAKSANHGAAKMPQAGADQGILKNGNVETRKSTQLSSLVTFFVVMSARVISRAPPYCTT